jgi:hypothetical protein
LTFNNVKRGMVRLWIVIACAVDLYVILAIAGDGSPKGTTWSLLFLLAVGIHVLWFVVLAAVLWVLNGFFLKANDTAAPK